MISIDELKSLPLTHGSFLLDDNWDAIKTNGLVASGGQSCGPNTFDLDVAMQRNEFVFSTIAHRYGYSLGDYVVIHPDVIYEVKCNCFLHDPGGMFDTLRHCWLFGKSAFQHRIETMDDCSLAAIVRDIDSEIDPTADEYEWQRILRERVCTSEPIRKHYECQMVTMDTLFQEICGECRRRSFTVKDYVSRRAFEWPFAEEVLIHNRVGPDFILGRVRYGKWLPNPVARQFSGLQMFLELVEVLQ
jgi:hypothetical protein